MGVEEIVLSFETLLSMFSEGLFDVIIAAHLLQSVIKNHVTQSFVRLDTLPTPLISPSFLRQQWTRVMVTGKCQKVAAYQPLGPKVYTVTSVFTKGWGVDWTWDERCVPN